MKAEIIRRVDKLGRIVLPKELRSSLGWSTNAKVSILLHDDGILLKAHHYTCCICGNGKKNFHIREKPVCKSCIDLICSNQPYW